MYGPAPEGQRRYSPAECIGAINHRVEGSPDPKHVSTSYAERQNLNIRMGTRRIRGPPFLRKPNIFVRIRQTLKVTPAMAAGVTGKLWEMSDMVRVLEDWEALQAAA